MTAVLYSLMDKAGRGRNTAAECTGIEIRRGESQWRKTDNSDRSMTCRLESFVGRALGCHVGSPLLGPPVRAAAGSGHSGVVGAGKRRTIFCPDFVISRC